MAQLNENGIASRALGSFLIFAITLVSPGQATKPVNEQKTFSEERPFERSVPVPPATLKALLATREAKEALELANGAQRKHPAQLFRATEISLGRAGDQALIVGGIRPMSGADNDWFWVVLSPVKNPRVVLFEGAYALEIQDSRTDGYRDIRSVWSSPSETISKSYRFNGRRYTLRKKTIKPNTYR